MKRLLFALAFFLPSHAYADVDRSKTVCVTPTVTASSAYSAGDIVADDGDTNNDAIEIAGLVRSIAQGVIITNVRISDKADEKVKFDLHLYNSQPGGTTTRHGAFDPTDADNLNYATSIEVDGTNADICHSFNDNGVCGVAVTETVDVPAAGGSLWLVPVTDGTPTYDSTSDLQFCFTGIPN